MAKKKSKFLIVEGARIHLDETKKMDGKVYYKAEVSDNAGTHRVYVEKSRVDKEIVKKH